MAGTRVRVPLAGGSSWGAAAAPCGCGDGSAGGTASGPGGEGFGMGTGTRGDRIAESECIRLYGAVRAFLRQSRVEGQGELSPVLLSEVSCAPKQ